MRDGRYFGESVHWISSPGIRVTEREEQEESSEENKGKSPGSVENEDETDDEGARC